MRYVINGETWLNYFGGQDVYYLSDIHFGLLASGYTTGYILGLRFVNWCIVKLYCNVTFCRAFLIIIVGRILIKINIH